MVERYFVTLDCENRMNNESDPALIKKTFLIEMPPTMIYHFDARVEMQRWKYIFYLCHVVTSRMQKKKIE